MRLCRVKRSSAERAEAATSKSSGARVYARGRVGRRTRESWCWRAWANRAGSVRVRVPSANQVWSRVIWSRGHSRCRLSGWRKDSRIPSMQAMREVDELSGIGCMSRTDEPASMMMAVPCRPLSSGLELVVKVRIQLRPGGWE